MKLSSVISKVLQKHAPMSEEEKFDIESKSALWFEKKINAARLKQTDGQELTFMDKAILMSDEWYLRIAYTVLYFWLIRFIGDLINPGDEPDDLDGHELPAR